MDLIFSFGQAVAKQSSPQMLARDLFNAAKDAALLAQSENPALFPLLELETKLWSLAVVLADNPSGALPNSEISRWARENIREPEKPSQIGDIQWASASDDEKNLFFRYLFELVLAGEHQSASRAAQEAGNFLLAATINATGGLNSNIINASDGFDTPIFAERCLYGLLSGNSDLAADLCSSWEQLLLVYAHKPLHLFEQKVASAHPEWAEQWQYKVMLAMMSSNTTTNALQPVNSDQLRVCLHLDLVRSVLLEPMISKYINELVDESEPRWLQVVPGYVALLPASEQARVYAPVLQRIESTEDQEAQLVSARRCHLNTSEAVQCVARLAFEQFHQTKNESCLLAAVQWQVAAKSLREACETIQRSYGELLLANCFSGACRLTKRFSVELLRSLVPLSELASFTDDFALLQEYESLAFALEAIDNPSVLPQSLINIVNNALAFGETSENVQVIQVRDRFMPIIVYGLLLVLNRERETSSLALEVATKLADEKLRLYRYFNEEVLAQFVQPALTSVVLLDK